jgi:two-component system, NtrC family, sensor histidine kinase HydH
MTIWRTLLLSFLAVSLLPTVGITLLTFDQTRKALEAEIARNLLVEASVVMERIDWMLFERLENVRTWTQLEVMQELRIGDLDKRVSRALADLQAGYGMYAQLFCTATDGRVVAASDPHTLGQQIPAQPPWLTVALPEGTVLLDPLSVASPAAHLRLHATIADMFQPGKMIGTLYALFDWTEIFRVLDQAAHDPTTRQGQQRMVILLDRDGRIIAASSLLRQRGLLLSAALASWPPVAQVRHAHQGIMTTAGDRLGADEVLVGYAHSRGYQAFRGFGWSTLVIQPTPQAFTPVWQVRLSFLLLLTFTGAIAVGVSFFIASRIARPILQLADLSRHFARRGTTARLPPAGSGEIGELTQAFGQMMQDLERSREDLIRAAQLAVVGEMAATMAHEVRTPLGILRSSAQMLRRETQLSPEGQEMAGFVISEADRLNRLIATLLECARPRPPAFQVQDIHAIIRRAVELLAQRAARRRIRIVTEFRAAPSTLSCDGGQLVQVFLNLLLNSLQMLPEGGEVLVRTAADPERLTVAVADDGPGIPPDVRGRVFDPFFTRREGGIGLGLTVVQQIVRTHGGYVTVSDSVQGGACFLCVFPHTPEQRDP